MSVSDRSWIVIVACVLVISLFLVSEDMSGDGSQDLIGFAAHPIYGGFSVMTDTFDLYSDLVYGSADPYKTLRFSLSDSLIYKTAYISVDGNNWQPVTLTGTTPISNWFSGSASGSVDVSTNHVPSGVTSNNYIAVYSCSRNGTLWDCNDNQWQITTFTTLKAAPTYSMSYIACVTADNYDATNNALPAFTIDNNLSDASRWSGYGDGTWLRYDFLNDMLLTGINIMFYKSSSRVTGFSLEYSTTGTSWTKIGDYSSSGSATGLESFRFSPITARYFRVIGHGNTEAAMENWTSIIEVTFTNSTAVSCNPFCSGKQCGSDGCTGTCGSCTNAHGTNTCSAVGSCQPSCNTGYGNCDGNNVNGCETNIFTSTSNCGSCGKTCSGTCSNGQCTTTPPVSTTGKIYYLSPTGSDQSGNGSITRPWFTLSKAWTVLQPGDTVYLRGGTYVYTSKQQLTGKNGVSGNLIKIWAYPEETPNLTISNPLSLNSWPYSLIYFDGDYFHWKGIEISGIKQNPDSTGGGAMRAESSNHNIFELLSIHDNGFAFHINGQSTDNLILNCDIYNIYDPYSTSTDSATGLQVADPYEDGDGFSLGYDNAGTFNTFRGCRAWNIADDGWDLWRNDGEVLIDNCWSWKSGYAEDGVSEGGNGQGFKFGISTTNGTNVLVTVRNSISCYNRESGYHQNGMLHPVALYNNIAYANGAQGFWFGGWSSSPYMYTINHRLTNNIAYKNKYNPYLTTGSILNTNTFLVNGNNNTAYSVTDADFVSLDQSQLLRPRNPDGSLPDITFLHLRSDSDLINKGVAVSGRTVDGAGKSIIGSSDIGPFETG